jgi:hypothetical protein
MLQCRMDMTTLLWATSVYRPGLPVCVDDKACIARMACQRRYADPKMNLRMSYLSYIDYCCYEISSYGQTQTARFVFWKSSVRTSARKPVTLTEVVRDFPQLPD